VILPLDDPRFIDLLAAWGASYSWGSGTPGNAEASWPNGAKGIKGGVGWDCSGFAQAALVRLGMLSVRAPDCSAATLYGFGKHVAPGEEQMGDLAFYGPHGKVQHVMVVVGTGIVLGARGGGSTTNADDARAFVQLEPLKYWPSAFLGVRRLPTEII
jgi:murein DD-endopeptidase